MQGVRKLRRFVLFGMVMKVLGSVTMHGVEYKVL